VTDRNAMARLHYSRRREHIKARMRSYYRNNPEKVKAHNDLLTAIRAGRIERKPCEVCGKFPADAHHDDYSRPLVVRWLCRHHHHWHHRQEDNRAYA